MIKNLKLLNNNIIGFLKNDIVYICFVVILLIFSYCSFKNILDFYKIPHLNKLLMLVISYLSFFTPKYGLLLIVFFCQLQFSKIQKDFQLKLNKVKEKLENKKSVKKEKFSKTRSYITESYSSVSSCAVCKAFNKPQSDKIANFKNKKINNRIKEDAMFRNKKMQNK